MNMKKQKGLSLLIAMIVLVVMSMAGIGLIRSVDTGVLVAGNLAFRQSATHAADAGVELARTWLIGSSGSLTSDNASAGYYASSQTALDLTGNKTPAKNADGTAVTYTSQISWPNTTVPSGMTAIAPFCPTTTAITTATGNSICYVIHRMCSGAGALDSATCSTKTGARGGSSLGALRQMTTYQQGSWSEVTAYGYYRVTVRVAGPRGNVSYTQAFLII